MWAEATALDTPARRAENSGRRIEHLFDLTDEERKRCLERVHDYFRKNAKLQARHGGTVELDKGPGRDAVVTDPG